MKQPKTAGEERTKPQHLNKREAVEAFEKALIVTARRIHQDDGELEIDDNAKVSMSPDGGAYVEAWVWVYTSDVTLEDYLSVTPTDLKDASLPAIKERLAGALKLGDKGDMAAAAQELLLVLEALEPKKGVI